MIRDWKETTSHNRKVNISQNKTKSNTQHFAQRLQRVTGQGYVWQFTGCAKFMTKRRDAGDLHKLRMGWNRLAVWIVWVMKYILSNEWLSCDACLRSEEKFDLAWQLVFLGCGLAERGWDDILLQSIFQGTDAVDFWLESDVQFFDFLDHNKKNSEESRNCKKLQA